jgi:hypothetical protein
MAEALVLVTRCVDLREVISVQLKEPPRYGILVELGECTDERRISNPNKRTIFQICFYEVPLQRKIRVPLSKTDL